MCVCEYIYMWGGGGGVSFTVVYVEEEKGWL